MAITLSSFLAAFTSNPILAVVFVLVLGVILVNGATDAANAIASVVSTRSLSPRRAIMMAAAGNFLGLIIMTMISSAVAETITNMVNFGGDSHSALLALAAAMVAIIVWGVVAWYFGIPTSQSHSLIAGISGAAIALQGGMSGINGAEWMKVIYGLALSTFLGFFLGWFLTRFIGTVCRNMDRRKTDGFFRGAQIFAAGGMAFMHGAQDGQKFLSIGVMAIVLAMGLGDEAMTQLPLWLMILCSLTMASGTALGGGRIIKSVAMDMVTLEKYQGFSASLAGTICILFATLTGIPVSTTHTQTTALMGVGAEKRLSNVRWGLARDMVLTWAFTFPGCGLMGFGLAKIFMLF